MFNDRSPHVAIAAAISLYSIQRQDEKVFFCVTGHNPLLFL